MAEQGIGVAQVGGDQRHVLRAAQQRRGLGRHHRVDVGVDDARGRIDPLHHLMGVANGGQPGADVDELPQPGLGGQPRGRPLMEAAVRPGRVAQRGQALPQCLGGLTVHLEVVVTAQVVVVETGRARLGGIHAWWYCRVGDRSAGEVRCLRHQASNPLSVLSLTRSV